ncbi:MAG: hypothetical protein LAQ30_16935 [Acidobacteriia bacterium]|nr:hypothetical protein [Terriglobia bacterium]
MPKSRVSAALSLLLVFVSGALVGVLAHRAYVTRMAPAAANPPRGGRRDPQEWRKHIVPLMREQMKMDDQQVTQLNQILDETDVQFRTVREKWNAANQTIQKSMVDQINGILRPDQQKLYADWREERERERQKHMQERRPNGPPPGPPPPGPPPGSDKK